MDLQETLTSSFAKDIEETLAAEGGGFLEGFIAAVSAVDAEGHRMLVLCMPEDQSYTLTLGLTAAAEENARMSLRYAMVGDGE